MLRQFWAKSKTMPLSEFIPQKNQVIVSQGFTSLTFLQRRELRRIDMATLLNLSELS